MQTMEDRSDRRIKGSICRSLRRVPVNISRTSERAFYQLGLRIAQRPGNWLAGSTVVVLLCLAGLLSFRQEKNPLKLWVPPDSDFLRDTEWLMESFGEGMRVETIMMTGDNVLEPRALLKLNEATNRIFDAHAEIGLKNASWTDVCFRIPVIPGRMKRETNSADNAGSKFVDDDYEIGETETESGNSFDIISLAPTSIYCSIYNSLEKSCYTKSILDIWNYDAAVIRNLTKEEIIHSVNTVVTSPSLGHVINYTELLGDISMNDNGDIIGAKAIKTHWYLNVNFSAIDMDKIGNDMGTADWATEDILEWETAFLKSAKKSSDELRQLDGENENPSRLSIWYESARSFGDISSSTMFQDITKVAGGFILMSIYVQIILSRFNWVEWRFCLTTAGLFCVGGAFIIAVGICSIIGIPYGPVHTSLPFMLMGLGVDDIFVMMASWERVNSEAKNHLRPLNERIALMVGHAGSSIFITSFTDVVAFVIGASTILPSLQSFCIYAAVGVFVTFLLQITFFVAFFALDARRIEKKGNGICPCIIHEDHQPRTQDNERLSWRFIGYLYSRIIFTRYGKIIVIVITAGITALGIYGSTHLEQRFDPEWFLPEDTYLRKYLLETRYYYPGGGHQGAIFMGELDYRKNFPMILKLSKKLKKLDILEQVDQWPVNFARFVRGNYYEDVSNVTEDKFQDYLSQFLYSKTGGRYQKNFRFQNGNLTCGEKAPPISVSSIDFTFAKFSTPEEWIGAMDGVKEACDKSGIDGFVTAWSKVFGNWVTDKVIAQEVTRNLILALICVMGTTAVLVAEMQTCVWIFLCVLLTLVDVCGFMYYWGLTVDIVSCIGLELAVGLSIDYATHVAHAFLNSEAVDTVAYENDHRTPRALNAVKHIGAAVVYGAGSTLLALSLLASSKAYVFRSFFKIFFLVVITGLWHGLMFLPVVLSTVGPRGVLQREVSNDADDRGVTAHSLGKIDVNVVENDEPRNFVQNYLTPDSHDESNTHPKQLESDMDNDMVTIPLKSEGKQ